MLVLETINYINSLKIDTKVSVYILDKFVGYIDLKEVQKNIDKFSGGELLLFAGGDNLEMGITTLVLHND